MKINIRYKLLALLKRSSMVVVAVLLVLSLIIPVKVSAAQLTSRKLTLGSSAGNTSTSWTFTFSGASATVLKGISFQICDAASGTCNTPGSWSNSGATYSSLTYNGSSQSGWTLDNSTAGGAQFLGIKNNSASNSSANPIVATFSTVTNPNTTNATFYVRINTFSGNDFTTGVDSGVVAASTAQQISLSTTVDESLVFCVGTSITGTNCGTISGSSVGFGTSTPTSTTSGTSVMAASTNGASGYSITANGSTLTCGSCAGSPTISALSSQTASSQGTSQFGFNLRDNATPNVGTDPSGTGSGTYTGNYGTADQYRFVTGDSVASAAAATNANTFTSAYIVNIPGSQAAGTYTTTLTYICTATF